MKALVTGIKPYLARLNRYHPDYTAPRFDGFAPIRTRKQVIDATVFNGNTGNYFIGEAAIEAVSREKATFIDFGFLRKKTVDPEYLAGINAGFDCVVFVTANLLRSDYDAAAEAELLDRFNLPIVVLGIGCQRLRDLPSGIPAGTLRFIEVLKSKDHHIFTRGAPSAAYLLSQGLKQVWPTGCPSLFLRPRNIVSALHALKLVDWKASLRIAFSGYLGGDVVAVRDIKFFAHRSRGCNYILQDEHLSYSLKFDAADAEEIYNDLSGELTHVSPFTGSSDIQDVRLRLFFNTHQWRAAAAMHDVSFGRRFHGVVAALQAGVPGLMIANDDRMREMLQQFDLPCIDVADWSAAELKKEKMALIEKAVAGFDADQWAERFLEAVALFRKRMSALGLG
jgi:hypothetical protein